MLESIQFFGYSGGVPTKSSATSSCIIGANDSFFLIDCAENTFINLSKAKYKLSRVHSILITHLHPDHIGGLIPFLFYKHVIRNFSKITLYGPENLESYVRVNMEFQGFKPGYPIEYRLLDNGEKFEIYPGLNVDVLLLEHRLPCLAYRIRDNKKCIAYITDTRKFNKLYNFAQHTDLLILEATFPDGLEDRAYLKYHLSVTDALEIAAAVKARRLILTHFSRRFHSEEISHIIYNGKSCYAEKRKIRFDKL